MNVILSSYLCVNAWTDWKRKEINLCYTIIFVVVGVVYKQAVQDMYYWNGMIPGVILIVLSFMWKQHIGLGDGIVVMACGWMCGLTFVYNMLIGGLFLAAVAGSLYSLKEKKTNVKLPFVPFLLGGYILELWT